MINRILIRIKVIQILYSFLLVEKQFSLEARPSSPTKEKRFAYALYLDILVLLVRLANTVDGPYQSKPLVSTRFISRLMLDETIKSLLKQYRAGEFQFEGLVDSLADKIKDSAIYKNYLDDLKKSQTLSEESLWQDIFKFIVASDPGLGALMAQRQNFTLKGVERMKDMIHRTFTDFLVSQENVKDVEDALKKSLDLARDLYFRLLWLPVELTDLQERILDDNRHKFLKTEEDTNPNLRFVENDLVKYLRGDEMLSSKMEKTPMYAEDPVMMRKLLQAVLDSDVYKEYMEAPSTNLAADCELWRNLMKKVIFVNPDFLQFMEDKSVFWNDDLDIISTFVVKSFKRVGETEGKTFVFDQFKDDEDSRFGAELIRYVYKDKDTYRRYINDVIDTGRWDAERLAFMDIVILETALAEIMNFPKIPLVASINEYIELAKSYSSAQSGSFVNGVLGSVVKRLQEEGKLLKR